MWHCFIVSVFLQFQQPSPHLADSKKGRARHKEKQAPVRKEILSLQQDTKN